MILPNNLPDELVTFLKDRGELELFRRNAVVCNESTSAYPVAKDTWIGYAFEWSDSKEGHQHWSDASTFYGRYLKSLKNTFKTQTTIT